MHLEVLFMQAVRYFPMMMSHNHVTSEAVIACSPHVHILAYLYWLLKLGGQMGASEKPQTESAYVVNLIPAPMLL